MLTTNTIHNKEAIYIDGKDKTSDVQSYSFVDEKCIVAFKSSNKKYTYNKDKVQIIKSALQSKKADTTFNYLKTIADAVGLKSEDGKNILAITATDNLNGFSAIIRSVFPESSKQVCVVHQIRNACRYVLWKDKKAFTADMQPIYDAPNKQAAQATLADFADRWESKYPYAVRSWKENWDELTVFYDFPLEIRRIIYTTNITENMNGKIRKYTI